LSFALQNMQHDASEPEPAGRLVLPVSVFAL
jgi:hypothetical protein